MSLYGSFGWPANTRFCDVWPEVDDFIDDYHDSGIYQSDEGTRLDDNHAKLLYYLLYARYGNDSIASFDRNRFEYGLFSIIFQYGPTWVKELEIQEKLRALDLTDGDLFAGVKAIHNHAYNPGTAPSTATLNELPAINEQNTTQYKKSKIDGYAALMELLKTDVSNIFLNRFKVLFQQVVVPVQPLWYTEHEEED